MAAQALPLAKLLAGEMPHDIEELFASCKLTLFPRSARELTASCTCPDWENPCKHIAAVYYILAERFDEDPFLIFAWSGRDKDELLERLRARRGAGQPPRLGRSTTSARPRRRPNRRAAVRPCSTRSGAAGPSSRTSTSARSPARRPTRCFASSVPRRSRSRVRTSPRSSRPRTATLAAAAERRALE